jgi:hypothetical protein
MIKNLLLLFSLFYFSFTHAQISGAQQTKVMANKYHIKINSSVPINTTQTADYIKIISAGETVTYNNSLGLFEVITKRKLEYNIIEGKLQKNATPLSSFVYVGEVNIANVNNNITGE